MIPAQAAKGIGLIDLYMVQESTCNMRGSAFQLNTLNFKVGTDGWYDMASSVVTIPAGINNVFFNVAMTKTETNASTFHGYADNLWLQEVFTTRRRAVKH